MNFTRGADAQDAKPPNGWKFDKSAAELLDQISRGLDDIRQVLMTDMARSPFIAGHFHGRDEYIVESGFQAVLVAIANRECVCPRLVEFEQHAIIVTVILDNIIGPEQNREAAELRDI